MVLTGKTIINRSLLTDPDIRRKVEENIAMIPCIAWNVEPTSHCLLIDQNITGVLRKHCGTKRRSAALWMSHSIYQASRQKADLIQMCRKNSRQCRSTILSTIIQAWRRTAVQSSEDVAGSSDFIIDITNSYFYQCVNLQKRIKRLAATIRQMVHQDKKAYRQSVNDEFGDHMDARSVREAHRALAKLKPYKKRPIPSWTRPDLQEVALEPADIDANTARFFCRKYDGQSISLQTHFERSIHYYSMVQFGSDYSPQFCENDTEWTDKMTVKPQDSHPVPDTMESLLLIPSMPELTALLGKINPHRTPDPTGKPPEIFRHFKKTLASIYHPLVVKAKLTRCEPAQWTYSRMAMVPKPGCSSSNIDQMRGISVGDYVAKATHRHSRGIIASALSQRGNPTMMGGLAPRNTNFAMHTVRCMQHLAKLQNLCVANIYWDLTAAFDNVHRGLLFHPVADHKGAHDFMKTNRVEHSPTFCDDAVGLSSDTPSVLGRLGLSPFLVDMLRNAKAVTSFTHPESHSCIMFDKGTGQGDPWGDVLFMALFEFVMTACNSIVRRDDIPHEIPYCADNLCGDLDGTRAQSILVTDTSFVDGNTQIIVHKKPDKRILQGRFR
eukprot:TRINITY_DN39659_c0_g1_i1.p1 TRINITY_DN39659_c0_g1~~TRINITY_DN39659_c0_g1_i1.p1  ORF type:complete len:716 (+),score=78.44 TRINITY_DN39659_c0_g1_i1:322-2148(+)